jgi:hypothetical protein
VVPADAGIADVKPYPATKDSGVPWLGEVPEDREVLPNRAVFSEVKERDRPAAVPHNIQQLWPSDDVGTTRMTSRFCAVITV